MDCGWWQRFRRELLLCPVTPCEIGYYGQPPDSAGYGQGVGVSVRAWVAVLVAVRSRVGEGVRVGVWPAVDDNVGAADMVRVWNSMAGVVGRVVLPGAVVGVEVIGAARVATSGDDVKAEIEVVGVLPVAKGVSERPVAAPVERMGEED